MDSSMVFCVQNVLPYSLCGQKMRSAPWLASTRPPDGVSLTPVESLNNPLGPRHWNDEDNMENNHKKMRKKLLPNDNYSDYDTITIIIVLDPCGGQSDHPNTANVNVSIFCEKWCFATKTMYCNILLQKPLDLISLCLCLCFGKSYDHINDQLYILSLLENQAVCKRASASHQRNITATPHATHNIQIDYGKSVPWVHLD